MKQVDASGDTRRAAFREESRLLYPEGEQRIWLAISVGVVRKGTKRVDLWVKGVGRQLAVVRALPSGG